MSSTASDAADRVATKLTGKFFVGQRVRLKYHFGQKFKVGYEAIIKSIESDELIYIEEDPIDGKWWNRDWWEPV